MLFEISFFISNGSRLWTSITSQLIPCFSISSATLITIFKVDPYDTNVMSDPSLRTSISPIGVLNSP